MVAYQDFVALSQSRDSAAHGVVDGYADATSGALPVPMIAEDDRLALPAA